MDHKQIEQYRKEPWMGDDARAEFDALAQEGSNDQFLFARDYFERGRRWWLASAAANGMTQTVLQAIEHFQVDLNDSKGLPTKEWDGNDSILMGTIWRMSLHQGYKKKISPRTQAARDLIVTFLDMGADPHVFATQAIGGCGGGFNVSALHCAVRSQFVTDVLLARGVDPNIGTALDPHATNPQHHQSVLYSWTEWATSCTSKERVEMMGVLTTLIKAGVDPNQPMRGWRRPNCQNNFLCTMWHFFDMQKAIPDMLAMGLDPHQKGADGLSFRDLLVAHAYGKYVPMGWNNEEKGRVNSKQKMRASNFLTWLDDQYPAPGTSSTPSL